MKSLRVFIGFWFQWEGFWVRSVFIFCLRIFFTTFIRRRIRVCCGLFAFNLLLRLFYCRFPFFQVIFDCRFPFDFHSLFFPLPFFLRLFSCLLRLFSLPISCYLPYLLFDNLPTFGYLHPFYLTADLYYDCWSICFYFTILFAFFFLRIISPFQYLWQS